MQDKKSMLSMVVVAILIGAGGFYTGMLYQKGKGLSIPNSPAGIGTERPEGGTRGGAMGVGARGRGLGGPAGMTPIVGEILIKDDDTVTVKMQDGSSKKVVLSGTSAITKTDTADKSALVVGENVRVFGSVATDGTVTAQSIQINPEQFDQKASQNTELK